VKGKALKNLSDYPLLVLNSFSVFWDTFVYHYTGIMPNFNDVYLDNYEVLDYGLICKKCPKWGLVSVALGIVQMLVSVVFLVFFLSFRYVHNIWRIG
jgi:hypothetical protein